MVLVPQDTSLPTCQRDAKHCSKFGNHRIIQIVLDILVYGIAAHFKFLFLRFNSPYRLAKMLQDSAIPQNRHEANDHFWIETDVHRRLLSVEAKKRDLQSPYPEYTLYRVF